MAATYTTTVVAPAAPNQRFAHAPATTLAAQSLADNGRRLQVQLLLQGDPPPLTGGVVTVHVYDEEGYLNVKPWSAVTLPPSAPTAATSANPAVLTDAGVPRFEAGADVQLTFSWDVYWPASGIAAAASDNLPETHDLRIALVQYTPPAGPPIVYTPATTGVTSEDDDDIVFVGGGSRFVLEDIVVPRTTPTSVVALMSIFEVRYMFRGPPVAGGGTRTVIAEFPAVPASIDGDTGVWTLQVSSETPDMVYSGSTARVSFEGGAGGVYTVTVFVQAVSMSAAMTFTYLNWGAVAAGNRITAAAVAGSTTSFSPSAQGLLLANGGTPLFQVTPAVFSNGVLVQVRTTAQSVTPIVESTGAPLFTVTATARSAISGSSPAGFAWGDAVRVAGSPAQASIAMPNAQPGATLDDDSGTTELFLPFTLAAGADAVVIELSTDGTQIVVDRAQEQAGKSPTTTLPLLVVFDPPTVRAENASTRLVSNVLAAPGGANSLLAGANLTRLQVTNVAELVWSGTYAPLATPSSVTNSTLVQADAQYVRKLRAAGDTLFSQTFLQ